MRTRLVTLIALFCAMQFAADYHLSPRFRTVYIVPMTNSLNEHLASRLTSSRVLWVVLEPSNADSVLTEAVDEGFWSWLDRTYPAPAGGNRGTANGGAYSPSVKNAGTVFLVDPRNRVVLWSMYCLPKNSTPAELDRTASRITSQLKTAFAKN